MLIHLEPCNAERLLYRTFAVVEDDVAKSVVWFVASLFSIRFEKYLDAQRISEHLKPLA